MRNRGQKVGLKIRIFYFYLYISDQKFWEICINGLKTDNVKHAS